MFSWRAPHRPACRPRSACRPRTAQPRAASPHQPLQFCSRDAGDALELAVGGADAAEGVADLDLLEGLEPFDVRGTEEAAGFIGSEKAEVLHGFFHRSGLADGLFLLRILPVHEPEDEPFGGAVQSVDRGEVRVPDGVDAESMVHPPVLRIQLLRPEQPLLDGGGAQVADAGSLGPEEVRRGENGRCRTPGIVPRGDGQTAVVGVLGHVGGPVPETVFGFDGQDLDVDVREIGVQEFESGLPPTVGDGLRCMPDVLPYEIPAGQVRPPHDEVLMTVVQFPDQQFHPEPLQQRRNIVHPRNEVRLRLIQVDGRIPLRHCVIIIVDAR